MTPLQKAAQAVIDRWDSPLWKDQPHTAEYIEELRKALEAEIAQTEAVDRNLRVTEQTVEPVAVFHGRVDSGDHGAFNLDILKMIPRGAYLYLHPPQPQDTTAVPEGYVLVPIDPTPAILDAMSSSGWKTSSYRAMLKAAQGEKP